MSTSYSLQCRPQRNSKKLAADCFQLAGSVAMLEVVAMTPRAVIRASGRKPDVRHEASRVHRPPRWNGGLLATSGARAAAGENRTHWWSPAGSSDNLLAAYRGFPPRTAGPWLLDVELLSEVLGKSLHQQAREYVGRTGGREGNDDADRPRRIGLRARRERPSCYRAAEESDEGAPLHSITSSARSRNDSGIVKPSALAVVRLTTRSNLVGCSTGMSPGFAPRRILST